MQPVYVNVPILALADTHAKLGSDGIDYCGENINGSVVGACKVEREAENVRAEDEGVERIAARHLHGDVVAQAAAAGRNRDRAAHAVADRLEVGEEVRIINREAERRHGLGERVGNPSAMRTAVLGE